ncbi:replication initiator [Streptomyces sp. NPDC001292]|uniref:replication initiator n=1 Tax=Streptomyces sp. NPDC001292 TaxID=3364558 RepID=UPI0036BB828F
MSRPLPHPPLSPAPIPSAVDPRGAVHFHAVIRLDGPEGGDCPPPTWATAELLTDAIRAAAATARVDGPVIDGRSHAFVFGRQLDVRTIRSADFTGGQELTERAVAAYIAKYATKGAETATGTLDRPIKFLAELAHARITEHARRMIRTAWTLGARPALADLCLRAWAHMLGFRGHFSTKSRRYSTTLGALRDARADWRRAQAAPPAPQDGETTLVLAHWVFAGTGKSDAGARVVVLPAFLRKEVKRHLGWFAEKGPDGLIFVREKGAAFRRTSFGRKWRRARVVAGLPDGFRFYDLRHTGHTLSTRSGATLRDTMVQAGQSSEKAALIYQHSDEERQREVAAGLDDLVRAERTKRHNGDRARHKEEPPEG